MVVKMSVVDFWVITPCGLAGDHQMFWSNTGNHLQDHTVAQPRRPPSTNSTFLEPKFSVFHSHYITRFLFIYLFHL